MKVTQVGHHKGNSTEQLLNKAGILKTLNIVPGQIILDVGCGNGYMTKEFSRVLNTTGKVYALDRSQEAIEHLEKEIHGTNISSIVADITQHVALPDSSIDLMYVSTVFHIFSAEQRATFQDEARRLLKPEGTLAIVEINKKDTPLGPPENMRVSPEELQHIINMSPLLLVRAGEYFYMQLFTNKKQ